MHLQCVELVGWVLVGFGWLKSLRIVELLAGPFVSGGVALPQRGAALRGAKLLPQVAGSDELLETESQGNSRIGNPCSTGKAANRPRSFISCLW